MTDRRMHPATARIAHISLRGKVGDLPLTDGTAMEVSAPLAGLFAAPNGALDRQLAHGMGFLMIDRDQDHAFGMALHDGYCGWIRDRDLRRASPKTHRVAAMASHLYPSARVQAPPVMDLPFGATLHVTGEVGAFAQTDQGFVPRAHLRALGDYLADPAAVALQFLGCPYLWGGNSAAGIDCSGLVQAALLACGIPCPADSDLQAALGAEIAEGADFQRGDLLFWRGHVAMALDSETLIHANGYTMSVAIEAARDAVARIAAAGGGGVTARRRVSRL